MSSEAGVPVTRQAIAVMFGGRSLEHDVSVVSGLQILHALDPEVFTAPDGSQYLLAAYSDTSQPIRVLPLDAAGRAAGPITVLAGLEFPWEYPFIENPSMVRTPGGDYLLAYSAGDWRTGSYSTATARCTGPLGPCTKAPARRGRYTARMTAVDGALAQLVLRLFGVIDHDPAGGPGGGPGGGGRGRGRCR